MAVPQNIFYYTEESPIVVPGYISINKRPDGKMTLTVRSRGGREAQEVELPESVAADLARAVTKVGDI